MLMRKLVSAQLKDLGAEHIETATNGQEALDMIEAQRAKGEIYDIVFVDWGMPVMDGMELVRRCKDAFQETAFVMLTGECEKKNVLYALEHGAASYIVKPVSHEDMQSKLEIIQDWLLKRRAAHEPIASAQ
jgi:YesN/AraC family two-component response regulator